jgi:hypothetical protein
MGDLLARLTDGNVAEVKAVLTSVILALAAYQVLMAAIGYRWLRPAVPSQPTAFLAHRTVGGTLVVLFLAVGAACLSYFEIEDDAALHAICGVLLLLVLGAKIIILRVTTNAGIILPILGVSAFVLFVVTWASAAAPLLGG